MTRFSLIDDRGDLIAKGQLALVAGQIPHLLDTQPACWVEDASNRRVRLDRHTPTTIRVTWETPLQLFPTVAETIDPPWKTRLQRLVEQTLT